MRLLSGTLLLMHTTLAFVLWPAATPPYRRAVAVCSANEEGVQNQRRQRSEARHNKLSQLLRECAGNGSDVSSASRAELAGLMRRGDTYDAGEFTAAHAEFKQQHNAIFVALTKWAHSANDGDHGQDYDGQRRPNVFYLEGSDGGTTAALRAAGFQTSQLHVANVFEHTVAALLRSPHNLHREKLVHGRAEDALSWDLATTDFAAVYLDGCGGATAPLIEMVQAVFTNERSKHHVSGHAGRAGGGGGEEFRESGDGGGGAPSQARSRFAIGFTLTAAEPTGRPLADREQDVVRAVVSEAKALGYTTHHVGDQPCLYDIDPSTPKRMGGTLTTWLACHQSHTP